MELINCDGCSSVILKVSIFSHEIVKRTAINACVISWLRMSGNFPGSKVVKTLVPRQGEQVSSLIVR